MANRQQSVASSFGNRNRNHCAYDLIYQKLCLFDIDLTERSMSGITQIQFKPCNINPDANYFPLIDINCSAQINVHRVKVNGHTADYRPKNQQTNKPEYKSSILNIKQYMDAVPPEKVLLTNNSKKNPKKPFPCSLKSLNPYVDDILSKDGHRGRGELRVNLPESVREEIKTLGRNCAIHVHIEYTMKKPKSGFYFYKSPNLPEQENHVYNYGRGTPGYARLCFPCIDTWSALCTWGFEITVKEGQWGITSGQCTRTQPNSSKGTRTYVYELTIPTIAANIGIVAGYFQAIEEDAPGQGSNHGMTHLCPVPLRDRGLLADSIKYTPLDSMKFYEDLLSHKLPFKQYRQIFVYDCFEKSMSFAGMTIFDARLLHPSIVIDQLPETRKVMAHALAQQFFGKYISPENDRDYWITTGLAGYIFGQWLKRSLGENEYRYWLRKQMTKLTDFEFGVGPVCLSPKKMKKQNLNPNASWGSENDNRYFSIRYIQSQSHDYHKMLKRKSILVMRIFEDRITTGLLNQAVNKLLVLAERICKDSLSNLVKPEFSPEEVKTPTAIQNNYYRGSHVDQTLTISTAQFLKACKNVCHRELQDIVDQWVYRGGIVDFKVKFKFDKNRNTLDISVEQTQKSDHGGGVQNYRGNMAVLVQELDGSFAHTVGIKPPNEKLKIFETKDSLGCHSRSRAKKAKKIPLMNKTEVSMELNGIDLSPILWVRVDPDMLLIRKVTIEQDEFMWRLMLEHERDICGQLLAVENLKNFASNKSYECLKKCVEDDEQFWRVRHDAALARPLVHNLQQDPERAKKLNKANNDQYSDVNNQTLKPEAFITHYKRRYYLPEINDIPKKNRFQRNIPDYFVQQAETKALGFMRIKSSAGSDICPIACIRTIFEMLKFNDNSECTFSDVDWICALLKALEASLTTLMGDNNQAMLITTEQDKLKQLPGITKEILNTTLRLFNMDRIMPKYKYKISQTCLHIIRKLQRLDYLPDDSSIFVHYAKSPHFPELRIIAINALVDYIQRNKQAHRELKFILEIGLDDRSPYIKHKTLKALRKNSPWPATNQDHPLNNSDIALKLWNYIGTNDSGDIDYRMRSDVVDLYFTLYGPGQPEVIKDVFRTLNNQPGMGEPVPIEGDDEVDIGLYHHSNPVHHVSPPKREGSPRKSSTDGLAGVKKVKTGKKSKDSKKDKKDKKKKKKKDKKAGREKENKLSFTDQAGLGPNNLSQHNSNQHNSSQPSGTQMNPVTANFRPNHSTHKMPSSLKTNSTVPGKNNFTDDLQMSASSSDEEPTDGANMMM